MKWVKICLVQLIGKEVPTAVTDDPYGSFWMETDQPVKLKKRRRSSLLLTKMPIHTVVSEENDKVEDECCRVSKRAENNTECMQENDLMHGLETRAVSNEADIAELNKSETKLAKADKILNEENRINEADLISRTSNKAVKQTSLEISVHDFENENGATLSQVTPKNDLSPEKETDTMLTECTPPDEVILTTPQSMSPDFPASPSSAFYLENQDNSYTSYIPEGNDSTEANVQDSNLDKQITNKFNASGIITRNIDAISVNDGIIESGTVVPKIGIGEESILELSDNSLKLDTSASDKENTVLSLSDKENTLVQNTTMESKDENKSSDSPGFLSLCKTFAEKVVDLVKTSPTYLTNILQDKSRNSESPSLKQADLKGMVLSPADIHVSCSDIKLALAPELSKSLDREIECAGQIVQVYSVTEIKTDKVCEQNDKLDKINKMDSEIKEDSGKANEEGNAEVSETANKIVKPKKRRKSVSKTFFNTYNAVSSELNKTVSTDGAENETSDKDNSSLKSSTHNSEGQTLMSHSVDKKLGLCGSKDIHLENSANGVNHVATEEVPTGNTTSENICSNTFCEPGFSSKEHKMVKPKKRRSADSVVLSEGHVCMKQNVNYSENTKEPVQKRKKYFSENIFTEIKDIDQPNETTCSEARHNEESLSGSCNSDVVNVTDTTASVAEDLSKLELQVSLPEPTGPVSNCSNRKKDRRRRRSNNFYFPSIYDDTDDLSSNSEKKQENINNQKKDDTENLEATENSEATISMVVSSDIKPVSQHCQVSEVTKEISQVSIYDNSNETSLSSDDFDADMSIKRRRRRKSADAASLKIQMIAKEIDNSPVREETVGPTIAFKQSRKRKNVPEIPLEDIYRNKNYKKPEDKTWETIFESPKSLDQYYSKRRIHTYIDFEKPTQTKLKRRIQRAVRNGWDPKKKKKTVLSDDMFQLKLADAFSELDEMQENSV